jgi:lipopolysaccharide transport system ATP-binding protein
MKHLEVLQISFTDISITNNEQQLASELDVRYPFFIKLIYNVNKPVKNLELSVTISTQEGRAVFTTHRSDGDNHRTIDKMPGRYEAIINLPKMYLMPGAYFVSIAAHQPMIQFYDSHEQVLKFNINETGTWLAKYQQHGHIGVVIADFPWAENSIE